MSRQIEPNFGWFGETHVMSPAVDWLKKKVAALDKKRRLHRFTLKAGAFKTGHSWTLRVPGRKVTKRAGVATHHARRWYDASAFWSTNVFNAFPARMRLPTGTTQMTREEKTLATVAGERQHWSYVYEEVAVSNEVEMSVLVGAMPLWLYLRKTQQVEGRGTHPGVGKAAIEWLKEFRSQRQ